MCLHRHVSRSHLRARFSACVLRPQTHPSQQPVFLIDYALVRYPLQIDSAPLIPGPSRTASLLELSVSIEDLEEVSRRRKEEGRRREKRRNVISIWQPKPTIGHMHLGLVALIRPLPLSHRSLTSGLSRDTPLTGRGFERWNAADTPPSLVGSISRRRPQTLPEDHKEASMNILGARQSALTWS